MAPLTTPERLATLEEKVSNIERDTTTIKGDVKLLLLSNAKGASIRAFIASGAPWVAILIATVAVIVR